jgi:hypothetical protein
VYGHGLNYQSDSSYSSLIAVAEVHQLPKLKLPYDLNRKLIIPYTKYQAIHDDAWTTFNKIPQRMTHMELYTQQCD